MATDTLTISDSKCFLIVTVAIESPLYFCPHHHRNLVNNTDNVRGTIGVFINKVQLKYFWFL